MDWNWKDGIGLITSQSLLLDQLQFSLDSRFMDVNGTNPEELLAAAHAGCFTMKLSFTLDEAGFKEKTVSTTCYINFVNGGIIGSHLVVKADIPNISQEVFNACVKDAELNCPISRSLSVAITLETSLNKK